MKRLYLVLAACCLTTTVAAQLWQQSPVNDHFYLLSPSATWHQSQQWAQWAGGNLATIRSRAENEWILSNVPPDARLWIGLTDEGHESTWVWASGEPVSYTNWASGQPDNALGEEHWAEFRADRAGQWNDLGAIARGGIIEVEPRPGVTRIGGPGISCLGPVLANVLRTPVAGDPWFGYSCGGAPPESVGYLLITKRRLTRPYEIGGMSLWVDPDPILLALPLYSGAGHAFVRTPLPAGSRGFHACAQFAWLGTPDCVGWSALVASDCIRVVVQ